MFCVNNKDIFTKVKKNIKGKKLIINYNELDMQY